VETVRDLRYIRDFAGSEVTGSVHMMLCRAFVLQFIESVVQDSGSI